MADNKYISLKVCGNQYANSGFMPLVSFNSPLFEVTDVEYGGFNSNSYFFTIKIEKSQVVYTMIKNNVRSCNAALREGSLKISMAIPKGYKISDGKSPYDALLKLKDAFLSLCMTCKDPVKGIYEFNSGMISPTILDDVAKEFAIEQISGPYHPMSVGGPKGYITLPEEQINLLLSDVQYSEFSSYGEIVVAQSVQATNYTPIVNLQVPRKSRFSVILDGEEDGYVENPDEEITVKGKKNTKFYDNQQFTFTISNVRKGQKIPNVEVDEEKEIVSINTTSLSTAKSTKVQVVFPKEVEGYFYTFKKDFQLVYVSGIERKTIILNDYVFTLKGEDIGWLDNPSNFKVTFNKEDEYRIKSWNISKKQIGEYQLMISVDKVVKVKSIVPETRNTDSDVIKVDVLFKEPLNDEVVTLCLKTKKGYKIRLSTWVSGSRCVFYIPRVWNIRTNELFVRYETSDDFYTSSIFHDRKSNTYSASDFEVQHKTFVDRKIKPNKTFIVSLISILVVIILGWCGFIYYVKPIIDKLLPQPQAYTCEYCAKTFDRNDLFTAHIHSVHLKYVCATCNERFPTQEDLTSHINSKHMTEVCEVCNKRFSSSEVLAEHRNKEHKKTNKTNKTMGVAAKPFKCGSCNESFDERAQLEQHIMDIHNSRFKCRLCDLWFNSMFELDNHMGSKHKHYECIYCGHDTYFDSRDKLNAHVWDKHPNSER